MIQAILDLMKNDSPTSCPACPGTLVPVKWRCSSCDLELAGHFALNEFAALGDDDLHFLRIFVRCEGRLRDMEPALGISYPTIKTRISQLRQTLAELAEATTAAANEQAREQVRAAALKDLENGHATFEQTLARFKGTKPATSRGPSA
jgi:hypothetical protein